MLWCCRHMPVSRTWFIQSILWSCHQSVSLQAGCGWSEMWPMCTRLLGTCFDQRLHHGLSTYVRTCSVVSNWVGIYVKLRRGAKSFPCPRLRRLRKFQFKFPEIYCNLPRNFKPREITVVRTSVYDRRTFPALRHDLQLTGNLLVVNRSLYMLASMANSAIHSLGVDKWVVSWISSKSLLSVYVWCRRLGNAYEVKGRYGVVCR